MKDWLQLSDEVQEALAKGQPVVALESTIIAHGFPYPENYQLALDLEAELRDLGTVPATIAILGGKAKVGLNPDELCRLAQGQDMPKASLRDIPVLMAQHMDGATTVASTMQIAHWAEIPVFVTGGIGGVHRHGEETMDISADLQALSRFAVTVICAGAKSVLDLPKTLEVLETLGVPILGYKSSQFPAFYLRDSGLAVDYVVEHGREVAHIFRTKQMLGQAGGLLVTVPIPEDAELEEQRFNDLLQAIMQEMEEKKISGKRVTPYLLKRLHEESGGDTVQANIALVKNNLRVGAEIAKALSVESQ